MKLNFSLSRSLVGLFLLACFFFAGQLPYNKVFAAQSTCPNDNGWVKVDSNDMSTYPVAGATQYCFKAGSDNSQGCTGGLFYSWPLPQGACGLSHWSYFMGSSTPTPTPTATASPSPSPTPTKSSDPSSTPTAKPSHTPKPTGTVKPTPTGTSIASSTPTATPNNGDVCPNIDGIQTSLPDNMHFGLLGDCLSFSDPGPGDSGIGGGDVLGASTGQVLGATAMAGTGVVEDALFHSIFTLGSLLTSFGIMKNGKKRD